MIAKLQDVFNTPEGWAVAIALVWSLLIEFLGMPQVLFSNFIPGGISPGSLWVFGGLFVLAKFRPGGASIPFQPIITGNGELKSFDNPQGGVKTL